MQDESLELAFIYGVLDALPESVLLIDPSGEPVYSNNFASRLETDFGDCGLDEFTGRALTGRSVHGERCELCDGAGNKFRGTIRVYPIKSHGDILGALAFLTPDAERGEDDSPAALPYASKAMADVHAKLERLSGINAAVLFAGEPGVGKESFARLLHSRSPLKERPFFAVDCRGGGLTSLLTDDKALSQAANAGLVYFDGLNNLNREEREVLLKIINGKRFGDFSFTGRFCYSVPPNFEELAVNGEFPAELYNRVSMIRLDIPPLRERPDDIPPLAGHYLRKHCAIMRKSLEDFSPDVWDCLQRHDWPLNLRDMDSFIGESVIRADGDTIEMTDVPFAVRQPLSLKRSRHRFTYSRIEALLAIHGRDVEGKRRVAKELGVGLSTLYRLIAKEEHDHAPD